MARKRKRNPIPSGLVLGTLIVGLAFGAWAMTSSVKPKKKSNGGGGDGSNGDGTDGGDNTDGDQIPDLQPVPGEKWKRGPNGKGRVFGKPNIALPDDLFASNKVLVDPNCQWVVEGELFLPPLDHPAYGNEREQTTLFATLQDETNEVLPIGAGSANQAWGYVAYLTSNGPVDGGDTDVFIVKQLFDEGAGLWKYTNQIGRPTGGLPINGFVCAGVADANLSTPLKDWRADMKTRVGSWLDVYFGGIPFS